MPLFQGKNYLFLKASIDASVRIRAEINPFYNFSRKNIDEPPSLYSEPSILPRFLYDVYWNRNIFRSREIYIPKFCVNPKKIKTETYLPPNPAIIKKNPNSAQTINYADSKKNELIGGFNLDQINTVIGGLFKGDFFLKRNRRRKVESARYLSLRDIVDPRWSEDNILEEIDKLYFSQKEKGTLANLVKILYAGLPSEEYQIIERIFADEPEFANFLSQNIFSIELIPLIHGNFLTEILNRMDERIIKSGISKLSPGALKVVQRSVSKNKFKGILDSPILPEKEIQEDLISIIEKEIYQRFSRRIYYEVGSYSAFQIPGGLDENENHLELIQALDSKNYNFHSSHEVLKYLGSSLSNDYFQISEWVSIIRFDVYGNQRDWEAREFHRLPPDLVLGLPKYPNARALVGAGITRDGDCFEFCLSTYEY